MIKFQDSTGKQGGLVLKDPKNLKPYMYRCSNCNSIVRKIVENNSYTVVRSKGENVERCTFCKGLPFYK